MPGDKLPKGTFGRVKRAVSGKKGVRDPDRLAGWVVDRMKKESHDETEDIEDLGTAQDMLDGIEKMLAGLRHLVTDVEDSERDDSPLDSSGVSVDVPVLSISGTSPALAEVFRRSLRESVDDEVAKAQLQKLAGPTAQVRIGREHGNPTSALYGTDDRTGRRWVFDRGTWHQIGSQPGSSDDVPAASTSGTSSALAEVFAVREAWGSPVPTAGPTGPSGGGDDSFDLPQGDNTPLYLYKVTTANTVSSAGGDYYFLLGKRGDQESLGEIVKVVKSKYGKTAGEPEFVDQKKLGDFKKGTSLRTAIELMAADPTKNIPQYGVPGPNNVQRGHDWIRATHDEVGMKDPDDVDLGF